MGMKHSALVQSLIEVSRCLGSAQASGDSAGVAHWNLQVDHYASELHRRLSFLGPVSDRDRIEFALRDAGVGYDMAAYLADIAERNEAILVRKPAAVAEGGDG